ncbi:nephrin-like [Ruditapes philippinarum]|uniref:nephrin-like n=1 Tax=Ruditapes philippinarum TaxID=129788 RepID=UPI00295BCC67|nr:nephrin-like [Ruditapes philippinarum]
MVINVENRHRTFVFAISATALVGIVFGDVKPVLQISQTEVWEFGNVTLRCSCPKYSTFGIATFYRGNPLYEYKYTYLDMILFSNKTCAISQTHSFLEDFKCLDNITFEITISLRRQENWTCSCGLDVNTKSDPAVIYVNVPVENINLKMDTYNIAEDITIQILNSSNITLECSSCARPEPNITWNIPAYSTEIILNSTTSINGLFCSHSMLYYKPTLESQDQQIYCTASNKNNEQHISPRITTDVLYPAVVNPIHDISIAEGSQLETFCPVINGNPSDSTVLWSRLNDEHRWNSRLLLIKNVSRTDDTDYTCSVITHMFPTIGSSLKVESKTSFHLNVFFSSEIKTFSVSKINIFKRTFVINERENASFECIAEANPPSDLTIENQRGDIILMVPKSNIARNTLHNASYVDAGEYICTGWNNYTRGLPTKSMLTLIVRTKPKPSSGDTSVTKVATDMHVDVTLIFTTWNYLDNPNKTVFNWFKGNISLSDDDSKYTVHSNELQTNLTIRNTTKQDLEIYKVNVQNSFGIYSHYYELKSKDKPDPPIDFKVLNDSITATSVTLAWGPGFNGGATQAFVIMFRMKHTNIWRNKSVEDNGAKQMNYTLHDLNSSQEYEIEMFAENINGDSTGTERILFKTKAALTSQVKPQLDDSSGILAGSVSSVILVAVIVGFVFFFHKRNWRCSRFKCLKSDIIESPVAPEYIDLDESRREINIYNNFDVPSVSTYEQLDTAAQGSTTYTELKDRMTLNTETSDYVNVRI